MWQNLIKMQETVKPEKKEERSEEGEGEAKLESRQHKEHAAPMLSCPLWYTVEPESEQDKMIPTSNSYVTTRSLTGESKNIVS